MKNVDDYTLLPARQSLPILYEPLMPTTSLRSCYLISVAPSTRSTSGGGPRSRCPTWTRTQHDSTHRESDIIMLLPTASTPSDTTSCRTGNRRSAGALVRSFKAWLRQLSFSWSAKVGDHAASTHSERSGAADSRSTDERTRDASSEALVARRPSSGLQIVHHDAFNPLRTVSDVFFRWCVPSPSTRWGLVCNPPTPLHTLKPRCRTEIGKCAFSNAGPLACNDLPPSLHCITDSKRFRKHFKTHYFNRTFADIL